MANTSYPHGFAPRGHLIGGVTPALSTIKYVIADQYNTNIFRGALVALHSDGTIVNGGTTTPRLLGAFWGCKYVNAAGDQIYSNFWPASTDAQGEVVAEVYDDPFIIYECQADDALTQTAVGLNADVTAEAGSAVLGTSTKELDSSTAAVTAALQLKIRGLVDAPDNAWGAFQKVLVTINEHAFFGAQDFTGF